MKIQPINIIQTKPYIRNEQTFTSNTPVYVDKVPENRAAFSQKNIDDFNAIYNDYYNSQNMIPLSDIKNIIDKLSTKYDCPRQLVLESMQALTQFANINSVKLIGATLNKNNIHSLSNTKQDIQNVLMDNNVKTDIEDRICDDNGIVNALFYLLDSKIIYPTSNPKNTYFSILLDKYKIELLEEIKKDYPEEYKKIIQIPDIKYFYISGWDSGINFANRNKNLEQETENLLRKSIDNNTFPREELDKEYLDRINNLGIKPIIIENNPLNDEILKTGNKKPYITPLSIFNQLKPNILSKNTFFNFLEANNFIREYTTDTENSSKKFNITAKYLKNYLQVYSPERLSIDLKELHKEIIDRAKSLNKTEDDIIYVLPSYNVKSQHYINYSYQIINNIPANKFINIDDIKTNNLKNKIIVYLDDAAFTGNSIISDLKFDFNNINNLNTNKIILANIITTEDALFSIKNSGYGHIPYDIICIHTFENSKYPQNKDLIRSIGKAWYEDVSYATIYPYMAPDNDSELAICLKILQNRSIEPRTMQIKYDLAEHNIGKIPNILAKTKMLTGYTPIVKKKEN